jgi:hypothetical protein
VDGVLVQGGHTKQFLKDRIPEQVSRVGWGLPILSLPQRKDFGKFARLLTQQLFLVPSTQTKLGYQPKKLQQLNHCGKIY